MRIYFCVAIVRLYFQPIFLNFLGALILAFWMVAALASPIKNSDFTLQIAAYPSLQEAETAQKTFRFNGIETEIFLTEVTGRGKLFRLRAGKFISSESARLQAEKWLASGKINSYWITKLENSEQRYVQLSASAATERTGTVADTTVKIAIDQKKMPEMGLGQLLAALDGKWGVRVPEGLSVISAQIVFPKAGVIKPVVVFLDEAKARPLIASTNVTRDVRFEPGVKVSPGANGVDYKHAAKLTASLRYISGYKDLLFDDRGYLVLGERIEGGSDLARALLAAAIKSNEVFEIEGFNSSDVVVFGALLTAEFSTTQNERMLFHRIQLDFSDFDLLQGDPQVLAAFDAGLVFLHELTHGVWKLPDDDKFGGVGECEAYINKIRRQLGLPERLHYHFKISGSAEGKEKGELFFVRLPRNDGEPHQYLKLGWDNFAVGGSGVVTSDVINRNTNKPR